MPNRRAIAADATFMVLYIGLSAALVSLALALAALLALETEFGPLHVSVSALTIAGLFALPLAPRIYRSFVGQDFSWRSNEVLGGER